MLLSQALYYEWTRPLDCERLFFCEIRAGMVKYVNKQANSQKWCVDRRMFTSADPTHM